mgnify:CR=1 FL=1
MLLYRDSVVSLSVYFDDLIVTTVKQKKEIDELGLLSKFEYAQQGSYTWFRQKTII